MSATPTPSLSRRALALGVVLTTFAATPAVASATGTGPERIDGNPRCPDGMRELKLDPVPQGTTTFTDGTLSVTVAVSGRRFTWTASQGVDVVLAKGGPMANSYTYSPEATSGGWLQPPTNASNGQPYGISHITVCYDSAQDVPPPPPPAPCEQGGPTTKPDGEPCVTPPPPAPCEEGGATTMPNGEPCEPVVDEPGPCEEGGATTMPNGEPCEPVEPGPCEAGGSMTRPNGEPCVPNREEPQPPTTVASTPAAPVVSMTIPSSGGVLGATARVRQVAGRAALRGPSRCVRGAFTARIAGRGIRRVTVFVNGRRVRVLRGNRVSVRIAPSGRVTRVRARVEFVAASRRRAQTLSLTALRCAQQAVSPSFTG